MAFSSLKWVWQNVQAKWVLLRQRPFVQNTLKALQLGLFTLVAAFLVHKLTQIGWSAVFESLPATPWFYLFFMLRFLVLPVSELLVYETVWNIRLSRYFPAFIRKRVYNYAVMGYSGEAFLTLWARRQLPLSGKRIVTGVKDNSLLSAFVSNSVTVLLIAVLFFSGGLHLGLNAFPGAPWLFAAALTSSSLLVIAVGIFHRRVLSAPLHLLPKLLSLHGGRQALIILLHAAMYASVFPSSPFGAWLIFIALQLVLSRIPFLPNQDIVYLTAALSLAPVIGAPEAAIAGMLVAEAGLSQLLNGALFIATAPLARDVKKPA